MLAKFLGYPNDKFNLNRNLTLASNNPFQESTSGNDAEIQAPKVFAATSGPVVEETIDSGSPFSTLDSAKENEVLGVSGDIIGWESIFAGLPQAFIILNGQQQVLFANTAQIELVGVDATKSGSMEAWLRTLCTNEEKAISVISSWHEHIWRNQLTRVFELNCRGEERRIEFRSTLGSDGHVILMLSDVTEDQVSGEALRQANFKFRSLFGNATGGVLLVDREGKIREVNKAFTEFAEMSSSDLVGKPFAELLNQEDAANLAKDEANDAARISDKKRKLRFSFKEADRDKPALVTPSYIFSEDRQIIHTIYQLKPRDQQLLGKLKELSSKAQALLNAVPDMFVLVDPAGVIRDWSPPADTWEEPSVLNADSVGKPAGEVWAEFGEFISENLKSVFEDGVTIRHHLQNSADSLYQSPMTLAPFGSELALVLIEKPSLAQQPAAEVGPEFNGFGLVGGVANWQDQFFAASKSALIVTDAEGELIQINPSACAFLGQGEAALLRSNLFQLLSKAPGTDVEFELDSVRAVETQKVWTNLLSISESGPRSVVATVVPVRVDEEIDSFVVTVGPKSENYVDPLSDERELAHSLFRSQLQIATSLFSITPESRDPESFNSWLMRLKVLAESMTTKKRVGVVHLMRNVADQVTSVSGNGRGLREVVISGSSALTIENEAATTFALLVGEIMHMGVSSGGAEVTGPSIYIDVEGFDGDIVLTAKPGEDRALFTSSNKDNAKVIEVLVEQLRGKISVGVGDEDAQAPSIRLAFPALQT